MMIGRELEVLERIDREVAATGVTESGTPVLKVLSLSRKGSLEAVDLDVFEGEVIGVAGSAGLRTHRARATALRRRHGRRRTARGPLEGPSLPQSAPRDRREDRLLQREPHAPRASSSDLSVADNMLLALQATRGWLRPIPPATRTKLVKQYIEALDIRPPDPQALMRNLSGGNQQKVLLARWLITEPDVLILDEPTRGIDIGAKAQIQALVADLARKGMAVVFISAELEEVLRLSDRVVVMRDRRKIDERPNDDVTVNDLLEIIAGSAGDGPETTHTERESDA